MNRRQTFAMLMMVACVICPGSPVASAQIASEETEQIVVIRDAHIIIGNGEEIERGSIVVIDGRIAVVGRSVEVPPAAEIIDASGMTVMPGMVHARSRAGQRGYSRSGIRPHFRAFDELVAEDFESEDLLRAGFTAVAIIPAGTGIPGTSVVLRTGGREEHRLISESAYLRVVVSDAGQRRNFVQALERAQGEIDKVAKAREEWEKAQAGEGQEGQRGGGQRRGTPPRPGGGGQAANDEEKPAEDAKPAEPARFEPPRIDPALRPLVDLLEGRPFPAPVLELSSAADLLYLEPILKRFPGFPADRFFVDGNDIHLIAEGLGARNALVLTSPVIRNLPNTAIRCNVPAEFVEAGCVLAFVPVGRADSTFSRVADLVRSGLGRDVAMQALTSGPARIAGVEDRFGQVAVGFEADLLFLDGHPLDGLSRVRQVMMHGEIAWEAAR